MADPTPYIRRRVVERRAACLECSPPVGWEGLTARRNARVHARKYHHTTQHDTREIYWLPAEVPGA